MKKFIDENFVIKSFDENKKILGNFIADFKNLFLELAKFLNIFWLKNLDV